MTDHATGRSRGFAFVTMGSAAEGTAAIEATNGKHFAGRALTVNEARPREDRGPRGGAAAAAVVAAADVAATIAGRFRIHRRLISVPENLGRGFARSEPRLPFPHRS